MNQVEIKASGANVIKTVDKVRSLLPQLRASISPAINVDVVMDRTPTIRASIKEVERTLVISFGLVIVVVFAFLRNMRAALLPAEGDKEKPETETEKAEREKKEKEAKEKAEKEKNGIKETNVRMEGEDRVYDLEIDGIPAGTWKEVTRNGEKFYKEVKPESSSTSKEVGIKINESGQVEITSYSSSSGNSGGNSGSTAPALPGDAAPGRFP